MLTGHTGTRFRTTCWTDVVAAPANDQKLGNLLVQYSGPIYAYLRRSGQSAHDAKDYTQAFIAHVLEKRNIISIADSKRGPFRSYIKTVLINFVRDTIRTKNGRPGTRPRVVSLESVVYAEPDPRDDPDRAYERQWAVSLLGIAVQRLEEGCLADGLDRHWVVFDGRVLGPTMRGTDPIPFEQLGRMIESEHDQEMYSMLQTMQRRFKRTLRQVIEETVADPRDAEAELSELKSCLLGCA